MALTLCPFGWEVQPIDRDYSWRQRNGTNCRPLPRKGETTSRRSLCALATWSWRAVRLSLSLECGTAATVIVGTERRRRTRGRLVGRGKLRSFLARSASAAA